MLFEEWLKNIHHINRKTFELRGVNVQAEMYQEYNTKEKQS